MPPAIRATPLQLQDGGANRVDSTVHTIDVYAETMTSSRVLNDVHEPLQPYSCGEQILDDVIVEVGGNTE